MHKPNDSDTAEVKAYEKILSTCDEIARLMSERPGSIIITELYKDENGDYHIMIPDGEVYVIKAADKSASKAFKEAIKYIRERARKFFNTQAL
jgi:hypothetical protein